MFGVAYELFYFPHPVTEEYTECKEFRIGLLFLQIRFRLF